MKRLLYVAALCCLPFLMSPNAEAGINDGRGPLGFSCTGTGCTCNLFDTCDGMKKVCDALGAPKMSCTYVGGVRINCTCTFAVSAPSTTDLGGDFHGMSVLSASTFEGVSPLRTTTGTGALR